MSVTIEQKIISLNTSLKKYESLVIAFSGGVDSTFLLASARAVLKENVVAVTAVSPLQPGREVDQAKRVARELGVKHLTVNTPELSDPDFCANPTNRCYICKKIIFSAVRRIAADRHCRHMAHGVNTDDLVDFRPGLAAAREMGVLSPLADAGLTKADIREQSRIMGLPTWNKPSAACLASRIPYGRPITPKILKMVEAAEAVLADNGFSECRVRHYGETAKIEIPSAHFERLLLSDRAGIVEALKTIGFVYVTLDMEGFESGRLNRSVAASPAYDSTA